MTLTLTLFGQFSQMNHPGVEMGDFSGGWKRLGAAGYRTPAPGVGGDELVRYTTSAGCPN